MQKKAYKKPEIKEVKLSMQDTLLTPCRRTPGHRTNPRASTQCRACRTTYTDS